MRTSEFSDEEYRAMLRFVADKAKCTQKPLAVGQLWKDFKKDTKSRRTQSQLSKRFRSEIAPQIQKMQQFEMDVKVQILFAMNCPLEKQFLDEILQSQKYIEVNESNVILTYSNQETGINLSALNEQGRPLIRGSKRTHRNLNETLDGTLDDDISFLKNEEVTSSSSGGVKKRKLMAKQLPVKSEPAPEDEDDDVQFLETVEFKPISADLQIQKPRSLVSVFQPLRGAPNVQETSKGPVNVAKFLGYFDIMLMALNNVKLAELRAKVARAIKEAKREEMMVTMESLTDHLKFSISMFDIGRAKEGDNDYSDDRSTHADHHQLLKLMSITVLRAIPVGSAHRALRAEMDEIKDQKVSFHYDVLLIFLNDIVDTIMNWDDTAPAN